MRRKIARRYRKEILRRGATLHEEGMIFSKKELKEEDLKRKDNGFGFISTHNGHSWVMSGKDELDAYRSYVKFLDVEEKEIIEWLKSENKSE